MPAKPLKSYMEELSKYMDAFTSAAGKPQRVDVVGDRVYWTQGKQQELFSAPVSAGAGEVVRVIASEKAKEDNGAEEEKLTKEEEMLRERLRTRTTGISSFRVRESDGAVFYTSGVDVYVYYQHGPRAGKAPIKIFDYLSEEDKAHFQAMGGKPNLFVEPIKSFDASHPSDYSVVTFVNNNNVYKATITERPADEAAPLSVAVQQITHIGDDLHQCGVADYIIQEEFARYTGHYATDRYVVFSYIESTHMRSVALLKSVGSPDVPPEEPAKPSYATDVEEMPYSRVGDPNARTTLVVYDGETKQMRLLPEAALRNVAPWTEYILRFGFKDAETLYVSVIDRVQEQYTVLSCPISALPVIGSEEDLRALYREKDCKTVANIVGDAAVPPLRVEWAQRIDFAWVECQAGAPMHYGREYDVLCRHAAETATAHYHLYARPARAAGADAWRPLTAGAWNVRAGLQQIDDNRVYFLANAEGRLKQVLYAIPLSLEQAPHTAENLARLTPLNEYVYSYRVKGDHFFYVSSTPSTPAKLYAARVSTPEQRREIVVPSWVPAVKGCDPAATADTTRYFAGLPIVTPHVVTVTSRRGVPLSASVFVAPSAPKGVPGPLAVSIYGGPHVQLVYGDDYDSICKAPVQVLLQHGISVAVVDNQMSNANGLRDMSICKKNMGSFETDDYVDVTNYLCSSTPAESGLPESFKVDARRVAIFGWSYGGYATLLAMCQAADVFKIGFAGAPVGDWKLYDTGYTERYMGTLYEDGEDGTRKVNAAYMTSTIGHYAAGFPEECNRLYIAHGLLDENVHFANSCHVVKALIEHAKPYNMLVYPGERHALRQNRQSRLHHDALLVKTLEEQL
ncbi:putative dipeptidyl-peptidase 8-like serine peptidase [Leptomonas pyrrhocoris]|uniref:Putative dipeptidyl-peptidase 8-like serine peptidase n=1 Tax=Leptomonas pyrrhocoris TaxID=157538 RepID=A0A0M9G1E7_LEPPY|nr:putative dipeptidyl-peptidase 8-like serine peptidase [Leptomonas pyrrhocoris]KPA80219.1 putative dipeptidyl-peptidase 8-like serine peptidase [Leptomonas pyrrhocoris]|eukprot:XP_015658658.1 putative dipeptidyl-peptidase 8-like serine peptidase [Leptomonas pyrrhocoris]